MMYSPGKLAAFSRACLRDAVAVVVVGFPATTLVNARMRVCISAAHTKEDLDYGLEVETPSDAKFLSASHMDLKSFFFTPL